MTDLLAQIDRPQDLNSLTTEKLYSLAEEIRQEIIINLAQTGGHLASSLGAVEIVLALHSVLDSPQDKIVWDVGHQAYAHKLITGRQEEFATLRQFKGMSGFPKQEESEHDHLDVGHSSTSISASLGMAAARDLQGSEETIVSVIGDGALTGGMAFEALNHAGDLDKDLVVVLNDNEMSISQNVGAVSNYLDKLRANPQLHQAESEVQKLITKIPALGNQVLKTAEKVKEVIKYLVVSGILFEELGFTYLGPIDGHDIDILQEHITHAQQIGGPVLIHTVTQKGKGYPPAEKNPSAYHGVGPFNIRTGKAKTEKKGLTYTQAYSQTLLDLAEDDDEIIAITAAMAKGTGDFKEHFPDRFFDVGIAEQHAVTFGAGLALQEAKPFVTIYSTFLQRAYDQIIHDLGLQQAPVKLALDRAGLVGRDGETHHGVFDFAYLRHVPNMTVMAPKDEAELQSMVKTAANYQAGPIAFRYPRGAGVGVDLTTPQLLEIGQGEVLRQGADGAILAIGSMVYPALYAAQKLAPTGIDLTVVNSRFVKPLDQELILELAQKHDFLFTIEEHNLAGGFGSAVAELLVDANQQVDLERIGLPDEFIEHGSQRELKAEYGLNVAGIQDQIKSKMEG
ncbi:1-deoxy-D-xylulose-5-phosphate synthase [Halanaerobaculum tunisiense]